jgi:hypothetical protein
MILPGKHLSHDRALLGVGAEILRQLDEERTVSELWERVRLSRETAASPLPYDWFLLALTFLYSIAALDFANGVISVRVAS